MGHRLIAGHFLSAEQTGYRPVPDSGDGAMSVTELRKDLEDIRASAEAGDIRRIVQTVDHALRTLDGSRLLTTTEAAEVLGIRSVNTLKLLVRQGDVPYETHGNRMMIPVSALEKLQQDTALRGIRSSDQAHDAVDALVAEPEEG